MARKFALEIGIILKKNNTKVQEQFNKLQSTNISKWKISPFIHGAPKRRQNSAGGSTVERVIWYVPGKIGSNLVMPRIFFEEVW